VIGDVLGADHGTVGDSDQVGAELERLRLDLRGVAFP
jgi:hypothetical protein